MKLNLPHLFTPRDYQLDFCRGILYDKFKRFILIWHRRSGKDLTCLSMLVCKALERKGTYCYIFPTFAQAKSILWMGLDNDGIRFIDRIPKELIVKKNEQMMSVELINGSIIKLVGSDNYDQSLVGTNPIGVIFSEYSLQKPEVWSYIEPILLANGGWSIMNMTPRGKNFAYNLYQMALKFPEKWFVSRLTIDDTKVISYDQIEEIKRQGTPDTLIQQEYFCSFTSFNSQYIYSHEMSQAEKEHRIAPYVYDPQYPLYTSWDIGVRDAMAIVFFQMIANRVVVVDHYENSGRSLQWYKEEIIDVYAREKNYKYKEHYAPHDIKQADMMLQDEDGNAMTRVQGAEKFGLKFTTIPRCFRVWDRIDSCRTLFPRIHINSDCTRLLECLSSYQKRKNDALSNETQFVFDPEPLHDWASNTADAFCMMSEAIKMGMVDGKPVNLMNNLGDDVRNFGWLAENGLIPKLNRNVYQPI